MDAGVHVFLEETCFTGNGSLKGAIMRLMLSQELKRAVQIVKSTTNIELSP